MHITLGKDGALLGIQVDAVVLVGCLGTGEGLAPVNCQMLAGTSPMKRTWMMAAVSERGRYG